MSETSQTNDTRETTARTRRPLTLDDAIPMLARTPATLNAMLRELPQAWIQANEGGATWSPHDVIGHLIHCERTDWMARVRRILADGETRPFDPLDRAGHAAFTGDRTLPQLLDDFAGARADNVRDLQELQLSAADLDRRGRHPVFGVVTLRQLLATWVAHDFDHTIQISRVLATQYADEVGPWRQFLRVISGQQG